MKIRIGVLFSLFFLGVVHLEEVLVPINDRIDCHPQGPISKNACNSRGCLFDSSETGGAPNCFLNPKSLHYAYQSGNEFPSKSGWNIMKKNLVKLRVEKRSNFSISASPAVPTLAVEFERMSTRVMGFRIKDAESKRYQISESLINLAIPRRLNKPFYRVEYSSDPEANFAFKIIRESSNVTIFDTSLGGLIFEDRFVQIVTKLPSTYLFGFGENRHDTFRHKFDWSTSFIFSRHVDQSMVKLVKNYAGVHPFYMVIEEDGGNAHGIFLLNSNAMEYKLQPSPALTIRTYGGVLDFIVCMGSTPNDVMIEYLQVVGRPTLPPFWALGLHEVVPIEKFGEMVNRLENSLLPVDVVHAYFEYSDREWGASVFTEELLRNVKQFHDRGGHALLVMPPHIRIDPEDEVLRSAYQDGLWRDVFVKWPGKALNNSQIDSESIGPSSILIAKDPLQRPVAVVDFFQEAAQDWWKKWLSALHAKVPWDGLWLEHNQPFSAGTNHKSNSSCTPGSYADKLCLALKCPQAGSLENAPYYGGNTEAEHGSTATSQRGLLSDDSICMIAEHRVGNHTESHYNLHNLYGLSQATKTKNVIQELTGKRGLIISESNFPSSGKVSASWLTTSLDQPLRNAIRQSIVAAFEYSMFGVTVSGGEIINAPADDEAYCRRFQIFNIFHVMPRSIMHSCAATSGLPFDSVLQVTKKALEIRFSLLPYLYSLFFHGWMEGEPIIRPLFYEYSTKYHDTNILDVDDQFLWGPAVLFVPHLELQGTKREVYFPTDTFYRYGTETAGEKFVGEAKRIIVDIPENEIGVFLRAGYIFPGFFPDNARNTQDLRTKPLRIHIASSQHPDGSAAANGNWFWDDGDSIDTIERQDYLSWFIYNRWQEGNISRALLDYDVERNTVPETSSLFFESFIVYGYGNCNASQDIVIRLNGQEVMDEETLRISYDVQFERLEIGIKVGAKESFKLEILQPV